jgi:hypothetical protein
MSTGAPFSRYQDIDLFLHRIALGKQGTVLRCQLGHGFSKRLKKPVCFNTGARHGFVDDEIVQVGADLQPVLFNSGHINTPFCGRRPLRPRFGRN